MSRCAYEFAEGSSGDEVAVQSGPFYNYQQPLGDLPRPSAAYGQDLRGMFGDELDAGLSAEAAGGGGATAVAGPGRDTATDVLWLIAGVAAGWFFYRS